jgi:hypothetical protein
MIEPIQSLAFSLQANKGVYALMLGSGLSRSADIPTGWEITLDLVRKLAALSAEDCGADPESWYQEKYGKVPEYSDLLDAVCKTPAERSQLIKSYIEPTAEEREQGKKTPTKAHHAIAKLVADGFVRVIVTTNFDQLTEIALKEVGIVPTVVSSVDGIKGAMPLIHTKCYILKIHGDYLDTRILNTPAELATFLPELDSALDRILDEFGLVICGWSGEWDEALRSAIQRSPSRRFSTYWAVKGELGARAQELATARAVISVPISDADTFFEKVQEQVESLEEFNRPHPLSVQAAVASVKRYLSEPKHLIKLNDLINDEVLKVLEKTSGERFAIQREAVDASSFNARIRLYDAATQIIAALGAVGGLWLSKDTQTIWLKTLNRLAKRQMENGSGDWNDMQRFPATLLYYALGIGAAYRGDYAFISKLMSLPLSQQDGEVSSSVEKLSASFLFRDDNAPKRLEGFEGHHFPLNNWLHDNLRKFFEREILDHEQYTNAFDRFEMLMAFQFGGGRMRSKSGFMFLPCGPFILRPTGRINFLEEISQSFREHDDESKYVKSGIFGKDVEEAEKVFTGVVAEFTRVRAFYR